MSKPRNTPDEPNFEAERLERLWAGEFGDAYVERNRSAEQQRSAFWRSVLAETPAERVLEVGCNVGANLSHIAELLPSGLVVGVDVNRKALHHLRAQVQGASAIAAAARGLPFRDGSFDLVFTMGVLIHQPPGALEIVTSEIVRCTRRFLLCGEYYSDSPTEVHYRGQRHALFKRDFGGFYQAHFPRLVLRKQAFLSRADGWDDVTYWLFEKS